MLKLNAFAISGLLITILFLPLSYFITKNGKTKVAQLYALHCLTVALWGIGSFWAGVCPDIKLAEISCRFTYSNVLFISVTILHSILELAQKIKYKKIILFIAYFQAIIFSILTLSGNLWDGFKLYFNSYYWLVGNSFYLASFIIWLAIFSLAYCILIWHYWTIHPEQKKKIYLLLLGAFIGFGGGLTNFFPGIGIEIYPIGNFTVPIYSIILTYAILQYQLLDINYVLRKGIVYFIIILLISLMYFFTFYLTEPLIRNFVGHTPAISGLLAAILLGFVYAPMRLKIEHFVDSTIFRNYHAVIEKQNALMEQELVRSEKFKMVSDITKGIIYEIRNPLSAIKTNSILILKRINDDDFIIKSSKVMDEQVERIDQLLQQLLKFSNPSAPQMVPSSIYEVINDVLNILKREIFEKRIIVKQEFNTKENVLLKIDSVQIRQMLYNIILNAIEAVKLDGTIILRTQIKEARSHEKNNELQNYFEIIIEDNGCGISRENLEKIFDPFFSLKEKKAGLGLSTAHKIIMQHYGMINVRSEVGKGSTFIILLPTQL